jgi:hypothetical protein
MADSSENLPSTDTSSGSGQSLVEDVLREAQALLAETGPVDAQAAPAPSRSPEEVEAGAVGEAVDLQSLVDRVDGLLSDLGHLAQEIQSAETSPSPGLDLTLVLPARTPEAEHLVPDLGPAGPQVDLFAASPPESGSGDAAGPLTPPAEVVLETEASATMSDPTASAGTREVLDDLAEALAAEFDQSDLVSPTPSGRADSVVSKDPKVEGGFIASPISATEVALMAAMTEEFGTSPRDLPPLEDEGDPFASRPETPSEPSEAARRIEAMLAERLAEEYDLVESAAGSTPNIVDSQAESNSTANIAESTDDVLDLVQSDIDAVARAELEAIDALGELDSVAGSYDERVSTDPLSKSVSEHPQDVTESDPDIVPPTAITVPAEPDAVSIIDEPTELPSATDHDLGEDAADPPLPRPAPTVRGPSALIRLGSLPFRILPTKFHRHVTPVAISLAAWIPLAWGYAILGPEPVPPKIEVLSAGLQAPDDAATAAAPGSHDASVGHDDHTGHAPASQSTAPPSSDPHPAPPGAGESQHSAPPPAEWHPSSHADHH